MVFITNKVVNYSNNDVWCCYSANNPLGGPDIWKVRLLPRNTRTEYVIDVDYIQADGGTINGKTGWWKLKQAGSFWIANNTNGGLTLGGSGGIPPWRAIFYYFGGELRVTVFYLAKHFSAAEAAQFAKQQLEQMGTHATTGKVSFCAALVRMERDTPSPRSISRGACRRIGTSGPEQSRPARR